jgi:hypothetical protein
MSKNTEAVVTIEEQAFKAHIKAPDMRDVSIEIESTTVTVEDTENATIVMTLSGALALADLIIGRLRPTEPEPDPEPVARRKPKARASVTDAAILADVARHPKSSVEEIAGRLGIWSKELRGPVTELVRNRKLKKQGQARGTRYTAS